MVTLLKFGAMQIPVMLILALVFALILDSGTVYAKSFFRVSFFIPYAVPTVIAALMWGFLYGPAYGPFTQLADLSAGRGRTSSARAPSCPRSPTSRSGSTWATT